MSGLLKHELVEQQLPATRPCVRASEGPSGQRMAVPALEVPTGLVMEKHTRG